MFRQWKANSIGSRRISILIQSKTWDDMASDCDSMAKASLKSWRRYPGSEIWQQKRTKATKLAAPEEIPSTLGRLLVFEHGPSPPPLLPRLIASSKLALSLHHHLPLVRPSLFEERTIVQLWLQPSAPFARPWAVPMACCCPSTRFWSSSSRASRLLSRHCRLSTGL